MFLLRCQKPLSAQAIFFFMSSQQKLLPNMYTPPIIYSFLILLSLSFIYHFAPQILLPENHPKTPLQEELDDLTLFKKAVKPTYKKVPLLSTKSQTPKIAFLFLTNSNLTFAPLWTRFFRGHHNLYNIYVHADPFSQVSVPRNSVFKKSHFIPSEKTERGTPSLISAERRLLARAILDDPFNLYFALVSQSCVPLHSFRYVYSFLFPKTSAAQSLLPSYIEIVSQDPDLKLSRYNARGEHVMLPEVPFEKFKAGSQFFVLAKRHALIVLKDKKLWRKFRMACLDVYSCYPEEHYFPTLLSMLDPKGCIPYTLTNVNWTGCYDGHPVLYTAQDVGPELVHKLRRRSNSSFSYFFARKFASDCLHPLMDIADDVIFRD